MNDQYSALYQSYQWLVPSQFNIAQACVHRWAQSPVEGRRIAIFHENSQGQREVWTYTRLSDTANQLANGLIKMGIQAGDRIAVVTEQRPETVAAFIAIFSVGAIALPLSPALGENGLATRLHDAEARVAIVDDAGADYLLRAQAQCPTLTQIIGLNFQHEAIIPWRSLLARQETQFQTMHTRSSSAALLLYAPNSIAAPKGTLLGHQALIGILPGFVAAQNWFPQSGDILWSPVDWNSAGGIMNALLPTLYFGHAIVSTAGQSTPGRAFETLARYQVSNVFLPADMLQAMMQHTPLPRAQYPLALRALMTEVNLNTDVFNWCAEALGVTPNAMFGCTEMNHLIGNSHKKWPTRPGSMGRPYPGHQVAVLDKDGKPCRPGRTGEIALNRYDIQGHPDPVLFLGYWRNDLATQAKFKDDWCLSGELAKVDEQGYYWYAGHSDDTLA
ncbi:AMP-binding protein [Alcaligenaceae bacterium]|nr:AMP-binding protein [Alcaligenaceae bacterium]